MVYGKNGQKNMQIPKQAKKVFSGVIFNVWQWQQEMFDGSFETFEIIERRAVVDIIATVGKKIIVLEQEQPAREKYPALPGGMIDAGESPINSAKRELREETGYNCVKIELLDEDTGKGKQYFHQSIFIARDCIKEGVQHLDKGEKITVKLVSFDEFLQLCRNPRFAAPYKLIFRMYECLLDKKKKEEFRKKIFTENC